VCMYKIFHILYEVIILILWLIFIASWQNTYQASSLSWVLGVICNRLSLLEADIAKRSFTWRVLIFFLSQNLGTWSKSCGTFIQKAEVCWSVTQGLSTQTREGLLFDQLHCDYVTPCFHFVCTDEITFNSYTCFKCLGYYCFWEK
jgi:hypothetical protein